MDVKSIPGLASSQASATEAKPTERGNTKSDEKNRKREKQKPPPEKTEGAKNVTAEAATREAEPGQILDSQKVVELLSHRQETTAARVDAFSKNASKPAPLAPERKKFSGTF